MHPACSACGLPFEQEQGQHWGAMVLAYAFGAVLSLPLFLVLLLGRHPAAVVVGVPAVVLAVLSPINIRVSRALWAHVMFHLHRSGR